LERWDDGVDGLKGLSLISNWYGSLLKGDDMRVEGSAFGVEGFRQIHSTRGGGLSRMEDEKTRNRCSHVALEEAEKEGTSFVD